MSEAINYTEVTYDAAIESVAPSLDLAEAQTPRLQNQAEQSQDQNQNPGEEEQDKNWGDALTDLVGANAHVPVKASWMGGAVTTLGQAMESYPWPPGLTAADEPYLISVVLDLLANSPKEEKEAPEQELTEEKVEVEVEEPETIDQKQEKPHQAEPKPDDKKLPVKKDNPQRLAKEPAPVAEKQRQAPVQEVRAYTEINKPQPPSPEKVQPKSSRLVKKTPLNIKTLQNQAPKPLPDLNPEKTETPPLAPKPKLERRPEEPNDHKKETPQIIRDVEVPAEPMLTLQPEIKPPLEFSEPAEDPEAAQELIENFEPVTTELEVPEIQPALNIEQPRVLLEDETVLLDHFPQEGSVMDFAVDDPVLALEIEQLEPMFASDEKQSEALPATGETAEILAQIFEDLGLPPQETLVPTPEAPTQEDQDEKLKETLSQHLEDLGLEPTSELLQPLVATVKKLQLLDEIKAVKKLESQDQPAELGTHEDLAGILVGSASNRQMKNSVYPLGRSALVLYNFSFN